jgi:hypothetical protein
MGNIMAARTSKIVTVWPHVRRVTVMVVLLAGSTIANAQDSSENRGTEEQRIACTGDVFRLCWSEIPDVSRIVGCLKREKPRLSERCREVFDQDTDMKSNRLRRRHHRRTASAGAG